MKKIKTILLTLLVAFIMPTIVNAASGSITVSGSSTAIKGNNVTVTVKLSSSTSIGSWEMELDYDKSALQLVSATSEAGGVRMANSSSGTKSKSYTFTFKALKTGNTKVSVSSYDVYAYADMSNMSMSTSSKTIKIMTQEELEATYSSNANLSSLKVEGYEITPSFDKGVYEYSLTVENDITSVNVTASKADGSASVDGTGTIELNEGVNKVEVTVTAQKGNTLTYVINIERKELNPISVTLNKVDYKIIRKIDQLPQYKTFVASTLTYENEEIPVLYSETLSLTLIGLKSDDGTIITYVYDGDFKEQYSEITSETIILSINKLPSAERFNNYEIREIEIDGIKYEAYAINDKTKTVIVYATNSLTGDIGYYTYDIANKTFQKYESDVDDYYQKQANNYKYVLIGFIALSVILLFILIVRKPSKKQKPNKQPKQKEEEPIEESNDVDSVSEIKYELDESNKIEHDEEEETEPTVQLKTIKEINEETLKNKKKKEQKKEVTTDTTKQKVISLSDNEEDPVETGEPALTPKEMKKLEKQQKKLLKNNRKKQNGKIKSDFDF